jgi:hypothetical protein
MLADCLECVEASTSHPFILFCVKNSNLCLKASKRCVNTLEKAKIKSIDCYMGIEVLTAVAMKCYVPWVIPRLHGSIISEDINQPYVINHVS